MFLKYLPDPLSFIFFYTVGITKNLSLVDIIFYLILQIWIDIPVLLKMSINNFYIKQNVIRKICIILSFFFLSIITLPHLLKENVYELYLLEFYFFYYDDYQILQEDL